MSLAIKRKCNKCSFEGDLLFFPKHKKYKNGRQPVCLKCKGKNQKLWRKNNKNKVREYNRRTKIKSSYGITIEEYENILNKQNVRCALCGCEPRVRRLAIDHCHDTGRIRGLLCGNCNSGLGSLKDNVGMLKRAIKYLEEQ